MAPVRDIAMYGPDSLEDLWFIVTKFVTDCGLKMKSTPGKLPRMLGYST